MADGRPLAQNGPTRLGYTRTAGRKKHHNLPAVCGNSTAGVIAALAAHTSQVRLGRAG